MTQMTPQEKMDWFWATGVVPGSIFDDWNDQKAKRPGQRRRQRTNWQRLVLKQRGKRPSRNGETTRPSDK